MSKPHNKGAFWFKTLLIVLGFIAIMVCQFIAKTVAEIVRKILRVMFLPDGKKALLSTHHSPPQSITSPVVSNRRLHVLKILESVNSFDSLSEDNVQYDLLFKKNRNSKGKNVSFSDPLTPDDKNAVLTSDEEDVTITIERDLMTFMSPGFE